MISNLLEKYFAYHYSEACGKFHCRKKNNNEKRNAASTQQCFIFVCNSRAVFHQQSKY